VFAIPRGVLKLLKIKDKLFENNRQEGDEATGSHHVHENKRLTLHKATMSLTATRLVGAARFGIEN
jgi:hypothetical protein